MILSVSACSKQLFHMHSQCCLQPILAVQMFPPRRSAPCPSTMKNAGLPRRGHGMKIHGGRRIPNIFQFVTGIELRVADPPAVNGARLIPSIKDGMRSLPDRCQGPAERILLQAKPVAKRTCRGLVSRIFTSICFRIYPALFALRPLILMKERSKIWTFPVSFKVRSGPIRKSSPASRSIPCHLQR